jgi:hypothetical protein
MIISLIELTEMSKEGKKTRKKRTARKLSTFEMRLSFFKRSRRFSVPET